MKIKGFPGSIAFCSFMFEFLNLPERLRKLGVEDFERYFIGSLHQINFTILAKIFTSVQASSTYNHYLYFDNAD